ncbi:MAG: DNA cytosine methyltransferase, partial [Thermofilum sp.]|nr:DNA cytosine methyltransferase [Thermofilum sp.]
MRKLTVVSLFSGAGGLDLGFVQTGLYEVVFANDVLAPAVQTYSRNFGLKPAACGSDGRVEAQPGVALECDVERVDFAPLRGAEVDVVVGGPPCQDFSIVRGPEWDRRGIEVRRGRLYAHFVRALVTLQPKAFLFENVPGLVSANRGLAYKVILEDLSNLNLRWGEVKKVIGGEMPAGSVEGYHVIFSEVLDFSRFGVPQRRERLIIVGIRRDLVGGLNELWRVRSAFAKRLRESAGLFPKYPLTAIEAFEGRRLDELGGVYREVMRKWDGVWLEVGTERAWRWKREVWDKLTFDVVKDYLAANSVRVASREELEEALQQHEEVLRELGYYGIPVSSVSPPDGTNAHPEEDPAIVERMRRIPPDENHEFVRGTRWEVEGKGISLVYRRLHPLKPSYTIVAYGGGGTHGY